LFAATSWGLKAENNPAAHGLSEIVYQFSSSSANNGSAFDGLGVSYGLNNNPSPSPEAVPVGHRGRPRNHVRTLPADRRADRDGGFPRYEEEYAVRPGYPARRHLHIRLLLFGTIAIVGALLFLPVAALGPLAEHLGPIPFGG
jgi:K+-transporting ATPase ATPase A chain